MERNRRRAGGCTPPVCLSLTSLHTLDRVHYPAARLAYLDTDNY